MAIKEILPTGDFVAEAEVFAAWLRCSLAQGVGAASEVLDIMERLLESYFGSCALIRPIPRALGRRGDQRFLKRIEHFHGH